MRTGLHAICHNYQLLSVYAGKHASRRVESDDGLDETSITQLHTSESILGILQGSILLTSVSFEIPACQSVPANIGKSNITDES